MGEYDFWSFGDGEAGCSDLASQVDAEGYTHGDFSHPWSGPSRAELIAFAARASRFVAKLIEKQSAENEALETAAVQVESA